MTDNRQWILFGILGAASVGLSYVFTCATPFAALATVAALNMSRRDGLLLVGAAWGVNQAIGFGLLGYPLAASTFLWGAAIGAGALMATLAVFQIKSIISRFGDFGSAAFGLMVAFLAYEAVLYMTAMAMQSGFGAFTGEIMREIFAVNVLALAGLMALQKAAAYAGIAGDGRGRPHPAG